MSTALHDCVVYVQSTCKEKTTATLWGSSRKAMGTFLPTDPKLLNFLNSEYSLHPIPALGVRWHTA